MGGGGGSTDIAPRQPGEEKGTIRDWYKFQQNQLERYIRQSPLLQAATTGALNFWNQLPGLTGPLQNLYANLPNISPTISGLQKQFGGLPGQLMGLTKPLTQTATGYLSGIIGSQGALSPEASRDVSQQTRTLANQYGTGRQLGTLGTELLNRQAAREARYATALGQYGAASGQIAGLNQAAQGLGLGLAQGIQGLRGSDIAQRSGLAGSIQNLQTGGLNQMLGVQQGNVGTFTQLQNPILSYLGNLFSGNLQARIAQAQINQQGNIASDNKTAGLIGGALSSIGSIAGAAAMSDKRLKTKIRDTGATTHEGVPLKTWEYKTRPGVRFLSPLAQDVESKLPERVLIDPVSGVKFVIGFPVVQISPPMRKAA